MRETCCECCLFVWKSSRNMLEAETILIAGSKNKLFVVLLCGTQLLEQFHVFGQGQYQRSPILIVIKIVVAHGRPLSHVVASLLACHLSKTTPRGNCGLPKFDRERCRHACAVHRIETQTFACLKHRSHRQRQKANRQNEANKRLHTAIILIKHRFQALIHLRRCAAIQNYTLPNALVDPTHSNQKIKTLCHRRHHQLQKLLPHRRQRRRHHSHRQQQQIASKRFC